MTSVEVCVRCGAEYRLYEDGEGGWVGECGHCGMRYGVPSPRELRQREEDEAERERLMSEPLPGELREALISVPCPAGERLAWPSCTVEMVVAERLHYPGDDVRTALRMRCRGADGRAYVYARELPQDMLDDVLRDAGARSIRELEGREVRLLVKGEKVLGIDLRVRGVVG